MFEIERKVVPGNMIIGSVKSEKLMVLANIIRDLVETFDNNENS